MHISEEAFRLLNDKFADALIKLDEAQARIKALEEGLRFYAQEENDLIVIVQNADYEEIREEIYDSDGALISTEPLGEKARKLLEKESEG